MLFPSRKLTLGIGDKRGRRETIYLRAEIYVMQKQEGVQVLNLRNVKQLTQMSARQRRRMHYAARGSFHPSPDQGSYPD